MSSISLDPIIRELVGAEPKVLSAALSVAKLLNKRNQGAAKFASDLLAFTSGWKQTAPFTQGELVLDFTVHVDRSIKPSYPDWMRELMYPELELAGPALYNLKDGVERRVYDDQSDDCALGSTIYKRLQKSRSLATCLNLQDGIAIQAKGIAVFRKLFAHKRVFLWGSVVEHSDGRLLVPFLYENGDEVGLDWRCSVCYWYYNDPALSFK